ncbi:MAG: hypothetical protein K6V73_07215 [Firmicutes bacterium]|nr:hypothetical protein [Bacillota bacterium]
MPMDRRDAVALAVAVAAAAAVSWLVSRLAPPSEPVVAFTVTHPVAPGGRLLPADLTPLRTARLPSLGTGPLYAQVPLRPGAPVLPADVGPTPPSRRTAVGPGMVAEAVEVPDTAVPAGIAAGDGVAVAGSLDPGAGTSQLLAGDARVLGVEGAPGALGAAPSRVYVLALPLPSALAVATAARNGSLVLLPWSLPTGEAAP